MNDLTKSNLPARSQTPVHFPEVPDYAIAALTLEWSTQSGHSRMPDNIITCTLEAYQGACKAWGVEKLSHILICREQLYLKAEHGFSTHRRTRSVAPRKDLSNLPVVQSRPVDEVKQSLKAVLAQWGEDDRETYVAFKMPGFILEAAKAQLPES